MTYLIIFAVIALLLAPVFWMMPSPRQKRQMQLRQYAMSLGLVVKVCDLPQTHRAKVRKEDPEQGVNYSLPWRRPGSNSGVFHFICVRDEQEMLSLTKGSVVLSILSMALSDLPETVVAIEYTSSGVGIYWRETGASDGVDFLRHRLDTLTGELSVLKNA
ncbi:MAG: hypothetical protein V3T17_14835 [Pseudomonadales bacterium]